MNGIQATCIQINGKVLFDTISGLLDLLFLIIVYDWQEFEDIGGMTR